MGKGQRIGYVRVSTVDQNTVRQLDGIEVDRLFEDKASGKDVNRPALQEALRFLRNGDVLVVHSMDRLARNLADLLRIVGELNAKNVAIQFIKENLTFTADSSPISKLLLQVMGAFAEFERALIRERQREGIVHARAAGKFSKERKKKLTETQLQEIRAKKSGGATMASLARDYGVSRETLYTSLKR